jgi:ketosteroid isomerase-like protein
MALAAFNPGDLQDFTRTFEDLFYAADAASMTSYYTEHAQLMADGIDPLQGQAAIAEFWRAAIARAAAARARRTIRLHESHSSGDLGYALCTVTVDIPPASDPSDGGTSIAVWDATIWQRDPGGTWRIAVDISTPLPRPHTGSPGGVSAAGSKAAENR